MKINKKVLILLLALSVILAGLGNPVLAGTKTDFTGVETLLGPIDFGETKCEGGECHATGAVWKAIETTSDPRTSGDMTIVLNSVSHLNNGELPMWGTFRIVNDQGEWNGTFAGSHKQIGENNYVNIQGTAHGSGGLTGLVSKWRWTGLNVSFENPYHQLIGTIIELGP